MRYKDQTKIFPAVIDTGSSFIAVPPDEYTNLLEKWKSSVKGINCDVDPTFCQIRKPCSQVAKELQPVSFRIENTLFVLKPMAYLHQGVGICQFAIAKNPLDNLNNGNFLFGSLFLKHFYTIYDFENEFISLGVNIHSKDLVSMKQINGALNKYNISSMGLASQDNEKVQTIKAVDNATLQSILQNQPTN